ncbi:hypothetical protein CH373_16045 [Leptospira perolatii]|uniref:Uncharacterized protein n=1 Tax=Leptospira perolatii TaxID=2023191 RepID=A0A2M9ZJ64_9LEPT|nr:hypothetical protein [Leptospira perolatii]PJZ68408.1 hypothetical protein CH360_16245 [Leptospira perolatii]PJZ72107.1 hypothetical protein CH373_16045 [Leptospira perolatii]
MRIRTLTLILFWLTCTESLFSEFPLRPISPFPSEYSQFWFLYESEKRQGEEEKIFRPFFSFYRESKSNYTFRTLLFPLYYSEETNYWRVQSVLFFATGTDTYHEDQGWENDTLSPLLIWGSGDSARENYFGFFPFYGRLRNKLSYSELNFTLFPIYAGWKYKTYSAHSVLWPIFLYGSSNLRSEFRLFPFFSKKVHKGKYERYSVLWPFFQWGETLQDKREPVSYWMFWPFYLSKDSAFGNMKARAFLWFPILGSLFSYGYDRRTQERDLNFLYFIFQYGRNDDEDYRKLIFFPFYGYYRYAFKETRFFTPFYFRLSSDTYHIKSSETYLIPFWWKLNRNYVQWGREETYYKLWPLFRWHEDRNGNLSWNFLSLFPIKSEAIERIWDPIWSIVEYQRLTNGERRLSLLMRLYTQRWTKDEFHVHVPFLVELSVTPEKTSYKFLYGFFGYENDGGKKSIQLLWFIRI